MEFNNKKELERALRQRGRKALEWLTQQVYKQLIKFIDEDIYNSYTPNMYERTYEFRDKAWAITEIPYEYAGEIASQIWYNPALMSYNPAKYQHGDAFEDRREKLAEILNRGVWDWSDWNFGRPGKGDARSDNPEEYWDTFAEGEYPRPFWDDFINWLAENWDSLAKQAFRKFGFKIE